MHIVATFMQPTKVPQAYEPDGEDLDMKISWKRATTKHTILVRCNVIRITEVLSNDYDPGRWPLVKSQDTLFSHRTFPITLYRVSLGHWERIRARHSPLFDFRATNADLGMHGISSPADGCIHLSAITKLLSVILLQWRSSIATLVTRFSALPTHRINMYCFCAIFRLRSATLTRANS